MRRALLLLATGLLLAGMGLFGPACSTEFDAGAESTRYVSMWGTLDAGVDTQWVRIGAFRKTSDPSTTPLDAAVSLVRLATGARAPFRDSLLRFESGFTVNTSWTTAPVQPGETYRIDVVGPAGEETRATVTVPEDYPDPTVDDGRCVCPSRVFVSDTDRLIDVVAIYRNRETGTVRRFSKRASIRRLGDSSFVAEAYSGDDAVAMGLDPLGIGALEATFVVANGSDDWPEGGLDPYDPETSLLLGDSGRIENGVGFVGGTVTKRVPFQPGYRVCAVPFGAPAEPCLAPER